MENNNGRETHNNALNSGSTKYKEPPNVSSKPSHSGIQKPKSVIDKLNKVDSRHFPGEKLPPKHSNKLKRPRSRSRSRSPLPLKNKKSGGGGMKIESDR